MCGWHHIAFDWKVPIGVAMLHEFTLCGTPTSHRIRGDSEQPCLTLSTGSQQQDSLHGHGGDNLMDKQLQHSRIWMKEGGTFTIHLRRCYGGKKGVFIKKRTLRLKFWCKFLRRSYFRIHQNHSIIYGFTRWKKSSWHTMINEKRRHWGACQVRSRCSEGPQTGEEVFMALRLFLLFCK